MMTDDYPQRRLAAAVLLRAVLDVRGVRLALEQQKKRDQVRASALAWLRSPDAAALADELNIDPAALTLIT